jgi:hypothetical protein
MKNTRCCHEGKIHIYLSERYLKTPPLISASKICLLMMPTRKKLQSTQFHTNEFFILPFLFHRMMCQKMSLHKGVPPTPSYLPRKFFRLPTKTPPGIAQLALAVGVPVPATVVGECVAVGPGRNPPSKARALAAAVLREGPLPLSDEGVGRSPIRGPSGPPARVSVVARARAFVRRKCDG